jgi:spermidine synthase
LLRTLRQCSHTKDTFLLIQVLKHNSVVHVDHVDLDEEVIETCREFFKWGSAWEDPRVHLHIKDGAKFVREAADGFYDVIIQDSSDPWTVELDGRLVELPSAVLYEEAHFRNMHRILAHNGVLNLQVGS